MPASSVVTTEDMIGKVIPDTQFLGDLPTEQASWRQVAPFPDQWNYPDSPET